MSNGTGATSIWQLFKERRTRDALYHAADYWDARAKARTGARASAHRAARRATAG